MQRHLTLGICGQSNNGCIFAIVEYLKLNGSTLYGLTLGIHHRHNRVAHWSVIVNNVNLRVALALLNNILGTVIIAINTCMHQHSTRCRLVKPRHIQRWLGLAGTHKIPLAINPHLNPRVVAISVCPTWCIYLTCGNTHCAQSRNGKC